MTILTLETVRKMYDEDNVRQLKVIYANGTDYTYRLFDSLGILGYKSKGRRKYGYEMRESMFRDVVDFKVVKRDVKRNLTQRERMIYNLTQLKKAYSTKLHPNLWGDIRAGYAQVDIAEFEKFLDTDCPVEARGDSYESFRAYRNAKNIEDIHGDNYYKITSVGSHQPRKYKSSWQYEEFKANISRHLANKEEFSYYWESNYDVSVSGKLCTDGIYRAWFSLEYRGCGNGHYYLLINETQAIFSEDD